MKSSEFDKWAAYYDDAMSEETDRFPFIGYYKVLAEVEKVVGPPTGIKILDVGIGTGLLSSKLAQQDGEIYGVDFSEAMIQKAKERIPAGKFDLVDVSKNHLGAFSNSRFDRLISSYWIHHLSDEQKISFLKKVVSDNLTENGKIIIADVGFETEESFATARNEYDNLWDPDEFYLCGERLVKRLSDEGLDFNYRQLSACAGALLYGRSGSDPAAAD